MDSIPERDPRDSYLARVVPGRTFAEVGGLWGGEGERLSVAAGLGASEAIMIDVLPADHHWWRVFETRMQEKGVDRYGELSADVLSAQVGTFDVVHSSGLLYHMPSPIVYLQALYKMTREFCILTSAICPTNVDNRYGRIRLTGGDALFVPALDEGRKAVYTEFYTRGDESVILGGVNRRDLYLPSNYSPWWWLLPPETIAGMCSTVGFAVIDQAENWDGRGWTFLLKSTGVLDVAPTG